MTSSIRQFAQLLRVHHWVKNVLIIAPLFFALQFSEAAVLNSLLAFLAFSGVASIIYIINDISDREADRLHPTKKERPIASGHISVRLAATIAIVLGIAVIALALQLPVVCRIILGVYAAMNVLYSFRLKRLLIVDVMIIAIGFVLRVMIGSAAIGVPASQWIVLCIFFGALFLGFAKRKGEVDSLKEDSVGHRAVLQHYTPDFLNQLLGVTAGMTVISYALYTFDAQTVEHFHTPYLFFTIPFVVYGIFHYFHLMYNRSFSGDATKVLLSDGPIIVTVLLWAATFAGVLMLA